MTSSADSHIKGTLGHPLAARLTGMTWCVTFVTVGELWQWATTRGGTGTAVGASAEMNRHSRLTSCAVLSTPPVGGRRNA
jgi:hypothetical protein